MPKTSIITYQCKYCGKKCTRVSTQIPLKPGCSKNPSKMHAWVRVKVS